MCVNTQSRTTKNEIDEHIQESFSDEHVNVHCVASWRVDSSKRLTINFHNGWNFLSDRRARRPDRLESAICELKRIS
jgi:hypothetical protein